MTESFPERELPLPESGGEDNEQVRAEQEATLFAVVIYAMQRWSRAITDPEISVAAKAAVRTLANLGISTMDTVPIAGEGVSWLADIGKFTDSWAQRLGVSTDLTPDVSKRVAVGSEILEAFTASVGPSHMVETALQFKADWPRLRRGFERFLELLQGEQDDYKRHPEIDTAIDEFVNKEKTDD